MNDDEIRAAYSDLLAERAQVRTSCVAPEALLAVLDRTAAEPERLATLRHVGSCAACRTELDLLRTAGEAAHAVVADRNAVRGRTMLAAAAILAVIAGGLVLWQALGTPAQDTLRAAGDNQVRLHAPAENAAATVPVRFVWSAVPTAGRYEIEIMRSDGTGSFSAVARDTVLTLGDGSALEADADYRWQVHAVMADGTRLPSPLRRLHVGRP